MRYQKLLKISKTISKNYFLLGLFLIISFVSLVTFYKLFFAKSTFVYTRVKVGQGLWWASTTKPTIWMVNSIKKGDKQYSLVGVPGAEILDVRYYPVWSQGMALSQYDIFLDLKLKVGYNSKTQTYSFNRSSVSVGSPVEIQFPSADVTGTVIELNKNPIKDDYVEKTVYLVNQGGYNKDFPYRFDNIKIGDSYFDGESEVFKVEDKWLEKNLWTITNNLTAQVFERPIESTQNIVVKTKMKLKNKNGELYYGEDYRVQDNVFIPLATKDYFFENFAIRKIED